MDGPAERDRPCRMESESRKTKSRPNLGAMVAKAARQKNVLTFENWLT
jgi:hypothetical protein